MWIIIFLLQNKLQVRSRLQLKFANVSNWKRWKMFHVPDHQVACDTSKHCSVSCFGHLQTLPETGISGTHLLCFLNHGLEGREHVRNCYGKAHTCCCQHGSKIDCSLMCTAVNFCFGLPVRKLELWTFTFACGDSELCYVWRSVWGIKSDSLELILSPCLLNGLTLNAVQEHIPNKMLVTSTV